MSYAVFTQVFIFFSLQTMNSCPIDHQNFSATCYMSINKNRFVNSMRRHIIIVLITDDVIIKMQNLYLIEKKFWG